MSADRTALEPGIPKRRSRSRRRPASAMNTAARASAPGGTRGSGHQLLWVALRFVRFNGIVLGVYVVAFLLWQLITSGFAVPAYILPSPLDIIHQVAQKPDLLAVNTWVTFEEVVIGFAIGVAVSIPLGVLLVYSRLMERVVYPFLVASQATPKVAVAPILVVWFGFGISSKVVLAFITAAFPIVINTMIGMSQTPREMIHLMRGLRASPLQIFTRARLPVAAPYIFGGLKIGITLAVVGAVVGEFVASNKGLGFQLLAANNDFNMPLLFAVVVVLAVMSSILFYAVEVLEVILLPAPLRKREHKLDPGVNA